MNKTKIISVSLIVLVIALLIIIPKFLTMKEKDQKNDRQNPGSISQVINADGYLVKAETLENEIKTIGSIRANEEVEIRSEITKKVTGIYFKEGTFVSRGKLLFKLDDADLQAKLKKQEVEVKLAISRRDRARILIDKGLTPEESFEVLENDVEKIKADIELTRVDISKTKITAPFSGMIGLRNVSIGTYVSPDNNVLATIQDISRLKIDFSVPEKYLSVIRKDEEIIFTVSGVDGEFKATVYAFEPKIENDTRTIILRAITGNDRKKLMPGNFADVTLKLSGTEDAILIPSQALIPQLKGQSVFIFRNGIAKSVVVEIGQRTEDRVQITSGINDGDTVITTNMLRLKPDAGVKIIKVD